MEHVRKLPAPPAIELVDVGPRPPGGREFLGLERVHARCAYPDGSTSERFLYDIVTRAAVDAVVVIPTFERDGERFVVLRSAHRVPLTRRDPGLANLWELPAGLIEVGETAEEAGARELLEEIGASLAPGDLSPLGPPVVPAPGALAEVQHFLRADIDPLAQHTPEEDGSPLERHAGVVAVPLREALGELARLGLVDSKTELGLRRLAEAT
ncbi:MAG: NUDIX hydrolase [Myxococcales bacterium]|nr:NUDIX hydrolase [Myxococcales bacterium]MBL0196647.1 NUDIX hydrolase [Myxococcales bacterium]